MLVMTLHVDIVCENGTEKDKEFNGSEGLDWDDCVGTNDEREVSDERSKGMLKDNAGMDGNSNNEVNAKKFYSVSDLVNECFDNGNSKLIVKIECNSNVEKVENSPNRENAVNKTYANIVKHDDLPKNLNYIPTLITDSGNEVVIFDEDLVSKGSERWNLNLCGQFVGYVMNIHESSAGLNVVLEKGHWMVKNKPPFVTKWNTEIRMKKLEPKCLPVWVKMANVSLEAWTVEGISAIASRLGKPMMMNTITATMCHKGIGNFEFTRVLVEMDAQKEFKKKIVFGHDVRQYKKDGAGKGRKDDPKTVEVYKEGKEDQNSGKHEGNGKEVHQEYISNTSNGSNVDRFQVDADNLNKEGDGSKVQHNKWNVKEKVVEEIRNTANKFSILNSLPEDNDQEIRILKGRMILDEFLNKKMQPNLIESMTWSKDMINYFKEKWEKDRQKEINEALDRRKLWKGLINDYIYVNGKPWCIAGDMNVILHPDEHSCRSSIMNPDMMEFQDCLNAIDVEDIGILYRVDGDDFMRYVMI
ncbi:RNA-directed DNA polymerase, eukaryota, reverse transcriptase zinc-binding domain protein [Tanacetum coccineum]